MRHACYVGPAGKGRSWDFVWFDLGWGSGVGFWGGIARVVRMVVRVEFGIFPVTEHFPLLPRTPFKF